MHNCSYSVRAAPACSSSASTPVQPLSKLFLPGICLLALLFSPVRTVPAWNSSASTAVQPLSGLFLPGIRLLALLFSLCQDCSCLKPFACPTVQHGFQDPLVASILILPFQIKMLPAYAFSPAAILLSAPSCRFLSLCNIH